MITNPVNNSRTQDFLKGVNILLKYNPNGDFEALHEQIFFGDLGRKEIEVSEKDSILLKELGWFIDEDNEEWSTFV